MFVALVDDNRVEIESLMRKCNGYLPQRARCAGPVLLTPARLTAGDAAIKCFPRAALRRRHISFRPMIIKTGRVEAERVKPDIVETTP
jgi:hypothetical protein